MFQDDPTQNPNQPGEWTPPPPPPPVNNPRQGGVTGVREPIADGGMTPPPGGPSTPPPGVDSPLGGVTPPAVPEPEIPIAGGEEPQGEQDGGLGGSGVPPVA